MMTNTYLPHVGGVARSVHMFSEKYREMGHQVIVVAPEFEGMPVCEESVIRIPAIQNFNGSDFSVALPISSDLNEKVRAFNPDIVHSHHPFLIGSTALRTASLYHLPHVFTYHTMYEQYTHYVPGDSAMLKRFVIQLAMHYSNLCDHVFAPSQSITKILRQRHVTAPISEIPTGVNLEPYKSASGDSFRMIMGIPRHAFLVGHVGRLAEEKNLVFLAKSLALFLKDHPHAHCLIAGQGPLEDDIRAIFENQGVIGRLTLAGILSGRMLISAYEAMNIFAFASHSETQGMVLNEAMAAKAPVIALDASGVREIVIDNCNGRLLHRDATIKQFVEAISHFCQLDPNRRQSYRQAAFETAEKFSLDNMAKKALGIYQNLIESDVKHRRSHHQDSWLGLLPLIRTEWELVKTYADSVSHAALDRDILA